MVFISGLRTRLAQRTAEDLFDEDWYLARYGVETSWPAFRHFWITGWKLGYDPNRWFSTSGYIACNPDVATSGMNPFLHYLSRGKVEGRLGFETAYLAPVGRSERRLARDLPIFPDEGASFNPETYIALNPDVAMQIPQEQMYEHFARAAPSENRYATWNPKDYEQALAFAGLDVGTDLVLHYAQVGRRLGLPADSESWRQKNQALLQWLGPLDVKEVRDANWRLREASDGMVLWACVNQDPRSPVFPSTSEATCARFFARLAASESLSKGEDFVADAWWLASYSGSRTAFLELIRQGELTWDESALGRVLEDGLGTRLSPNDAINLTRSVLDRRSLTTTERTVSQLRKLSLERRDFTHIRWETLEQLKRDWEQELGTARTLLALNRRDEALLELGSSASQVVELITSLTFPCPQPKGGLSRSGRVLTKGGLSRSGRVLIVTTTSLSQCLQFRVIAKKDAAAAAGLSIDWCRPEDLTQGRRLIHTYSGVIFYRCFPSFHVLQCVALARQARLWTAFEIDDAIIDLEYPGPLQQFEGAISGRGAVNMSLEAIGSITLAKLCEFGLGSTDTISEDLRKLTLKGQAFTIPNTLDIKTVASLASRSEPSAHSWDAVTYATASKSAVRDLLVASRGLTDRMLADNNATLDLICPPELVHALPRSLRLRASALGAHHAYEKYLRLLGRSALGLVPLADTPLNQAKSQVRWLDYTVAGLITVASPVGVYHDLAQKGLVLSACGNEEWSELLGGTSTRASALPAEYWKHSRDTILKEFTPTALALKLDAFVSHCSSESA